MYPQTGPYADEGADEFRAYELAVKHLNGEGDGVLNTMKPSVLRAMGSWVRKLSMQQEILKRIQTRLAHPPKD